MWDVRVGIWHEGVTSRSQGMLYKRLAGSMQSEVHRVPRILTLAGGESLACNRSERSD